VGKMGLSRLPGTLLCPARKISCENHKINPLLAKLLWSRWLDIGLMFLPKKELCQYPAILTSSLVNNQFYNNCRISRSLIA